MDKKFGKLNNGNITFAPPYLYINGICICNPQSKNYLDNGWFIIKDEAPICEDGYYAVPNGWEIENNEIIRLYKIEKIPETPKQYSKLKIIIGAKSIGIWDSLKEWIENNGYSDLWNAAQNISNEYQGFDDIINMIIDSGIADNDTVQNILRSAET